jgi:hypothetical protein
MSQAYKHDCCLAAQRYLVCHGPELFVINMDETCVGPERRAPVRITHCPWCGDELGIDEYGNADHDPIVCDCIVCENEVAAHDTHAKSGCGCRLDGRARLQDDAQRFAEIFGLE